MKTVLLVEDDSQLCEALKKKLEREDLTILVARDGEEGLKSLSEHPVDLILLDIIMPKMDGFQMIDQLEQKRAKTGLPLPPIIILTNKSSTSYPEVAKEVLIKSNVSLEDIALKIRTYLA